jgi:hypothetical protein
MVLRCYFLFYADKLFKKLKKRARAHLKKSEYMSGRYLLRKNVIPNEAKELFDSSLRLE